MERTQVLDLMGTLKLYGMRSAYDEVMATAIGLGGTITGEHGVGRLKVGSLEAQLGPDVMALTRRVKHALDPQGILNPGAGF